MLKFLDYLWRLFATGLCFACFGIGGLLMSVLAVPCVYLGYRSRQQRTRAFRYLVHIVFRLFIRMMAALGIIRFDLSGAEAWLREQRGKVIIANHPSLIDVVVLIALMPHADCINKEALWRNIFIRGVMSAAGYIRNSGDIEAIVDACRASLEAGYSLIIFPEGTRTEPGNNIHLQRGAANIALRCGVDMVSVLINCEPPTLTKHQSWYSIPSRRIDFSVHRGKVFRVAEYTQEYEDGQQSLAISARRLTENIEQYLRENQNSYGRT